MTQAERNVIYAVWRLERFKRAFAVEVTAVSLAVLQRIEEVKNTEGNYERIQNTRARAERLGEAGRLDNIQVDQAKQTFLPYNRNNAHMNQPQYARRNIQQVLY